MSDFGKKHACEVSGEKQWFLDVAFLDDGS